MREIAYTVRGFLTVRRDSLRVPLRGSLALRAEPGSGLFTGDLVLQPSTVSRTVLGASLFSATVQIAAESPVIGGVDDEGRVFAAVTVDAVIAAVHAAGRPLISGGSCRTATDAIVPLRSRPGFRAGAGRPPGRPVPPAALHRVRVDHAVCQSAGRRPGERRRHRSHPAPSLRETVTLPAAVPAAGCPAMPRVR